MLITFQAVREKQIYFTFCFLLFSSLCFPVPRYQDSTKTSRTNYGYDIIQKGEEIINSLNKKVINSLNKTEKPFYFKCGNVVVEQLTLPYRIMSVDKQVKTGLQ